MGIQDTVVASSQAGLYAGRSIFSSETRGPRQLCVAQEEGCGVPWAPASEENREARMFPNNRASMGELIAGKAMGGRPRGTGAGGCTVNRR
ncbi:MAG: hypothetical protein CBC48_14600 [bacterium TMED88]|nr:hypothetical protein [Deltaproteobacteria bacterium]OUV27185.1 MAG: hypothetical protein CBC48_14600 [bacterium TMED88]